jgi:hypothetical protein
LIETGTPRNGASGGEDEASRSSAWRAAASASSAHTVT